MVSQAARGAYAPGNEPYVFINQHTRVLVQGFTGGAGTFHSKASIDYGTKIVGGTNPRKAGTMHLGLPVFGTVAEGIKETGAEATFISVPPPRVLLVSSDPTAPESSSPRSAALELCPVSSTRSDPSVLYPDQAP